MLPVAPPAMNTAPLASTVVVPSKRAACSAPVEDHVFSVAAEAGATASAAAPPESTSDDATSARQCRHGAASAGLLRVDAFGTRLRFKSLSFSQALSSWPNATLHPSTDGRRR